MAQVFTSSTHFLLLRILGQRFKPIIQNNFNRFRLQLYSFFLFQVRSADYSADHILHKTGQKSIELEILGQAVTRSTCHSFDISQRFYNEKYLFTSSTHQLALLLHQVY